MKFRKKTILTLSCLFTANLAYAAPSEEWTYHKTADGQHPNDSEQMIVWLMNRARQDPAAEGVWLATSSEDDVAGGRDYFKVDTTQLQNEFHGYTAKPPAAFDVRLYNAAYEHSVDLIARNAQDHNGQFERVTNAGFQYSNIRGNVFAYADNALNAHAAWNIDWGGNDGGMQATRGHRKAVMALDANYANVGIAAVANNTELVTTGNYAVAQTSSSNHFNRFIVGTVWKDINNNARYDVGEASANVTVMPNKGKYYAITSVGGGYAIPVTEEGEYQVSFSGGDLQAEVVKTITVSSDSVLLDYKEGDTSNNNNSNETNETTVSELTFEDKSNAIFDRLEQDYSDLFSPHTATQTQGSGNELIYYRIYNNQYQTGLAMQNGQLFYAINLEWNHFGTLDQGNQALCNSQCW